MSKLTANEIIVVLKEKLTSEYTGFSEPVKGFALEEFSASDLGLGAIEVVHTEGGYDKGSNYVKVFHFIDHDVYLSVEGSYSSYEGLDIWNGWDAVSEVRPKKVEVTIYE
jgi:hypothetical protein